MNVTSATPRNLKIPCACHENCTSLLHNPYKVLRLPRKVTVSCHVSCNQICSTPPSIQLMTCHENTASMQHPETQIPMSQTHASNTPKHHPPNANPNATTQQTTDLIKRCACAVNPSSTLQHLTFPHDSSLFHTNLTCHASMLNPLQKLPPMAAL